MRRVRFSHCTGQTGTTIDTGYLNVAMRHAKC